MCTLIILKEVISFQFFAIFFNNKTLGILTFVFVSLILFAYLMFLNKQKRQTSYESKSNIIQGVTNYINY